MQNLSIWFAVVVFACAWRYANTQAQPKNVTELKLGNYGWQPPEPIHAHELDTVERHSIAIDHKGRVLVGFPVLERGGLLTREQPALSFHIVRLTTEGRADLSLTLPTNGWRSNSLYLSDTDQIIARANDSIQMVADDAEAHATKDASKTIATCGLRCRMEQSFSRRTLFLETWDADLPVTIVDTSQPTVTKRCPRPPYSPHSVTDKFAYFSGQGKGPAYTPFLYRWPLCDYEHGTRIPTEAAGYMQALNDESFVIASPGKGHRYVQVLSPDGHPKFRQQMAKHDVPMNRIRSSERGDRFAIDVWTMRGGISALDISGHGVAHRVVVYSSETGKQLAEIPVNPAGRYGFDFALSPDGHRLAIVVDDVVRVADLEEIRPAEKPTEHAEAVDPKDGSLHQQIPIPAGEPKQ